MTILNTTTPKNVLLVGATRGLGLALAIHYLKAGYEVTVCGRNPKQVPDNLFCQYPLLRCITLDVSNTIQFATFIKSLTKTPELCIYCAGCYFNERRQELTLLETRQMLAVNKHGFDDCFRLMGQQMLIQGKGHLVAVASMAGVIQSQQPSLYARLKSQMIQSALDYRAALSAYGVQVTVVAPGYIDTAKLRELNEGDASGKPFLISETQAVTEITTAIAANRALHIFPKPMRYLARLLNLLPTNLTEQLLSRRK